MATGPLGCCNAHKDSKPMRMLYRSPVLIAMLFKSDRYVPRPHEPVLLGAISDGEVVPPNYQSAAG